MLAGIPDGPDRFGNKPIEVHKSNRRRVNGAVDCSRHLRMWYCNNPDFDFDFTNFVYVLRTGDLQSADGRTGCLMAHQKRPGMTANCIVQSAWIAAPQLHCSNCFKGTSKAAIPTNTLNIYISPLNRKHPNLPTFESQCQVRTSQKSRISWSCVWAVSFPSYFEDLSSNVVLWAPLGLGKALYVYRTQTRLVTYRCIMTSVHKYSHWGQENDS